MKSGRLLVQQEGDYWNQVTERRIDAGDIPLEADLRRGALINRQDKDSQMNKIVLSRFRKLFLNWVSHAPKGRVLDIGCGPGWLSLELGRRGQYVDAFDLSLKAIEFAKRMLKENPYRRGFGSVKYHVQDVNTYDMGHEQYDAVAGWSSMHHLQDLSGFIERVWLALKPNGILATMDDLPQGRLERGLQWFLLGLLPIYDLSYLEKASKLIMKLARNADASKRKDSSGKREKTTSPLESFCTEEIAPLIYDKFLIIKDFRFNAFVFVLESKLKGPTWFRYPILGALALSDRILCRTRTLKGGYRIIIARKKN